MALRTGPDRNQTSDRYSPDKVPSSDPPGRETSPQPRVEIGVGPGEGGPGFHSGVPWVTRPNRQVGVDLVDRG